jgi:transglutaminase-like putative cysteine protease
LTSYTNNPAEYSINWICFNKFGGLFFLSLIKLFNMTRKLLFFLLMLLIAIGSSSQNIRDLIEDAGNAKDYPGSDLLIIFDSTHVDVQETGLSYVNTHRLYKVLTAAGAKRLAVYSYGYDPMSAFVEIKNVIIHRSTGEKEILDITQVLDYPAPARMIYWGASEKMIEVGRLEPGDALEVILFKKGYTYALLQGDEEDEKYIPPMRGHFYDIIEFWSKDPVLLKSYIVEVPNDKPVQYEFYNGEAQSSVLFKGEKVIYSFSKKDLLPLKREPGMVSWSDVAPKLLMSTSPDWYAKSLWFYGVNEDYGSFESTPEIDAKVKEILINAQTEIDSITLLTHWVGDEIRYSGISMGEGEGFTLHSGEMNFTDRCGVCKDKAGMLITMLRAAGFESYPAMTMAGSRIDYIPADQFNHCVTIVKMNNGEYELLDPTWVPFVRELWSSAEQQQNYLMGVPEGADLGITPLSPPENHYFKLNGTSEILEDGTLTGSLHLTAEGQTDASIRGMFTRYYKSTWEASLERELKSIAPLAIITSMDYGNPYDYLSGPINIYIDYEIPDYALVTDNEIIFIPIVASNIFSRGMSHLYTNTSLAKRNYPFRDRCSRLVELNETIIVPDNYQAIRQSYSERFEGKVASFEGGFEQSGNTIDLFEKIVLNKRIYDPEDWPEYKKVVKAQNSFAKTPIILVKK